MLIGTTSDPWLTSLLLAPMKKLCFDFFCLFNFVAQRGQDTE